MATLEELREWLRGNKSDPEFSNRKVTQRIRDTNIQKLEEIIVAGEKQSEHGGEIIDELLKDSAIDEDNSMAKFPSISKEKMVKSKEKKSRWDVKYTIASDGSDVMLNFGKHRGNTAKGIISIDDESYLIWLVRQPFPEDLVSVVLQVIRDSGKAFMLR